jgi:hypothetical protein
MEVAQAFLRKAVGISGNEAVSLAAQIRDEMCDTHRRETTISWVGAQDSSQVLRRGQTVNLREDLSDKGPSDSDFCQVVAGASQTLRTAIMKRFAQLQPTECQPKVYLEPESFPENFSQVFSPPK